METISLDVQNRQKDEDAKALRRLKLVPCIVYGNMDNTLLKCKEQELYKTFVKAGENTIVELQLDGKMIPVLFHEISFNPVTDGFDHVDFYAVDMNKEVTANVPIRFRGESPAVKSLSAVLVTVYNEVQVTALPKALPHELIAQLEKLANFGDAITIADLAVPEGAKIEEEPETVIATVQEPRIEKEPEPTAEGAESAAVEGAEGEKKEGEEANEGESAAGKSEKKEKKE